MYLAVDGNGRMSDVVFRPDVRDLPTTLDGLTDQLAMVGETTAFLRAHLSDGRPGQPVAQADADRVTHIGWVFKLYVLGADRCRD